MALVSKSLDEITVDMVDTYDSLLETTTGRPLKVKRNNNNKLYLVFRAISRGFKLLLDAVLALRNRFDPLYCEEADLYSTCRLVGTERKEGKGSMAQINIVNTSNLESKMFYAGVYVYRSVSGMTFSFKVKDDYLFDPGEGKVVSALSSEKGAYRVEQNSSISVSREDKASIDPALKFSCEDNINRLGYEDETGIELRNRILYDIDRQDSLKELEMKIRNLPDMFECCLILNASENSSLYDGIAMGPRELLVVITGTATNDLARLVAEGVLFTTCQTDPALVTYYENGIYIDGKYPVYYMFHENTDFSIKIHYQYNSTKVKPVQVEEAIDKIFENFTRSVQHIDSFSEGDVHDMLSAVKLPGVAFLDVNVMAGVTRTPYLKIPRTRLPHLTGIDYVSEDTNLV